jgi:hypothetical protein
MKSKIWKEENNGRKRINVMVEIKSSGPVVKYVSYFAASYFIFLLIITVLLSILGDYMSGLFYAIAMLGAGRICVYLFLKENGRIYTREEKIKLIIGTFLSAVAINVLVLSRGASNKLDLTFYVGQVGDLLILIYFFGPFSKYMFQGKQ